MCMQARKITHGLDGQHQDVDTGTGLSVEESIRMTENRDKWRKYVHGVTNPRVKDGQRTVQTEQNNLFEGMKPRCGW